MCCLCLTLLCLVMFVSGGWYSSCSNTWSVSTRQIWGDFIRRWRFKGEYIKVCFACLVCQSWWAGSHIPNQSSLTDRKGPIRPLPNVVSQPLLAPLYHLGGFSTVANVTRCGFPFISRYPMRRCGLLAMEIHFFVDLHVAKTILQVPCLQWTCFSLACTQWNARAPKPWWPWYLCL